MSAPRIDWSEVRAAIRRSKIGAPAADDPDLCHRAFAADGARYGSLCEEVHGEISERIRATGGWS